jgi:hypothetical protein
VFALIEPGHIFVGPLFEVCLAADRSYMLQDDDGDNAVQLSAGGTLSEQRGYADSKADPQADPEAGPQVDSKVHSQGRA